MFPDFSKLGDAIEKLNQHFERIAKAQEETLQTVREIRDLIKEENDNGR